MADEFEHLNALRLGLSQRTRLATGFWSHGEYEIRKVWIAQREREIAGEIAFLAKRGLVEQPLEDMTDAELLAELGA